MRWKNKINSFLLGIFRSSPVSREKGLETTLVVKKYTKMSSHRFSKIKNWITMWSSNTTAGYLKELKAGSQEDICTPMFIVLFTTTKK